MKQLLPSTWLAFLPLLLPAGASVRAQEPAAAEYVCPPCGAECHFKTSPKPGKCAGCGMELVALASVPQAGVILAPGVDLVSSTLVLGVLAGSSTVRAFTVADTTDPLRAQDALEMRPQFAYADAPALDVLVVPDGWGAWEDPLILEWVKKNAERARFVITVGGGSVVLAQAGFLAGEKVPAQGFLLKRGPSLAPDVVFDGALTWRRTGKFLLARDALSALDATLAVVKELGGEDRARETAARLGRAWPLESKPEAK